MPVDARFCLRNHGLLSCRKRERQFAEPTDAEGEDRAAAVRAGYRIGENGSPPGALGGARFPRTQSSRAVPILLEVHERSRRDRPAGGVAAHATWLRGLARSLVADPDRAEDVVQDTWLTAVERPPILRGSLRAWLAAVARNVVRGRARADRRRLRREEHAVAARGEPTPSDLVEKIEVHQRLVTLVRELDEPFRTTILLRYFEDLAPREIATRLDVPASTIRGRLVRGHECLRARLEHGDAEWRSALLPLAGIGAPVVGAPVVAAVSGGLVMGSKLTVAGALVAVAALAILAWRSVGDLPPPPPPDGSTVAESRNQAGATDPSDSTPPATPPATEDRRPERTEEKVSGEVAGDARGARVASESPPAGTNAPERRSPRPDATTEGEPSRAGSDESPYRSILDLPIPRQGRRTRETAIALSRDGSRLAVLGHESPSLRVVETRTGREIMPPDSLKSMVRMPRAVLFREKDGVVWVLGEDEFLAYGTELLQPRTDEGVRASRAMDGWLNGPFEAMGPGKDRPVILRRPEGSAARKEGVARVHTVPEAVFVLVPREKYALKKAAFLLDVCFSADARILAVLLSDGKILILERGKR